MTKKEEIITLDPEVRKDLHSEAVAFRDRMRNTENRIERIPIWTTNVSLGLLGFFVALLLQMKSSEYEFNIIASLLFFTLNLTSIIIGFILRAKYEFKVYIKNIEYVISDLDSLMKKFAKAVDMEWEAERVSLTDQISELGVKKATRKKDRRKWMKAVSVQLYCLYFSFLVLLLFLLKYIYFN